MPLPHISAVGAQRLSDNHFLHVASECAICISAEHADIDDTDESSRTSIIKIEACGHIYHELCLSTWLETQLDNAADGTCPECRQTLVQAEEPIGALSHIEQVLEQSLESLNALLLESETRYKVLYSEICTTAASSDNITVIEAKKAADIALADLRASLKGGEEMAEMIRAELRNVRNVAEAHIEA